MIVVLCDSYQDAMELFHSFLDFLMYEEGYNIRHVYYPSLCIETYLDLRYIFVDYRMEGIFREMTEDIIDSDEFFEDLDYTFQY